MQKHSPSHSKSTIKVRNKRPRDFYKKRQKYLAEELLYFISTLNIPEDDLFDRVNFIYQKAFFEVSFGDTSTVKTMKKCQYFFELCGSYQIAQKLEQEIKSLETLIKSRKPR